MHNMDSFVVVCVTHDVMSIIFTHIVELTVNLPGKFPNWSHSLVITMLPGCLILAATPPLPIPSM